LGDTEGKPKINSPFDDDEGYYKIKAGDHLLYRYEIVKILGKGSFA
jgi:dual specificity tyrosine-phosphorylation-regulated kinase 2/3/4